MRFAVSKVQGLVSGSASRRLSGGRRAAFGFALAVLGLTGIALPAAAQTLASLPAGERVVSGNGGVNKGVEPMTDQDHLHVADRWDLAEDGIGDCEDFQLLKRHLLAEAGLPRRAMRMTVVIDEKGEGHAGLTLITDRGDLVLDTKTSAILPW